MALNPIKKLAGETAIYGLGTIVPRLLNYFLVPLYTYVFTQEEYGRITELYAWVAIMMVVLTYGMETAFFRYAELEKNASKVFSTAATSILITSVVFLAAIILFINNIAGAIHYEDNNEYIILLAIIVAIDAFTALPFAFLRYQNKAKRFAIIKVISVAVNILLNLVFILVLPKLDFNIRNDFFLIDASSLIIVVFVANLISSIVSLLLLIPELKHFKIGINRVLFKKLLLYGLPILIIGIAGMINEVSDKILLRYFLPDDQNAEAQIGIYGASYKLAILMMLFIQMFRYAAEPFFFRESSKKDAKEIYSKVMTYFVIFTLLIFLTVTLYIDIFKYFIGPAFWIGLQIVPIILAAKMFLGIFYNLSVWYKLTNKTLYGAIISIIGALITIVLNILLIPKIGYLGSAWANLACYFSMMVISYFWGRRIYQIHYQLKKIILYSMLTFVLYFISYVFKPYSDGYNIVLSTILILIFTTVIFFSEKRSFKTMV